MSARPTDDAALAPLERLVESDPASAVERLRQLLESEPLNAGAYRLLAKALAADRTAVASSIAEGVRTANPALMRAARAIHLDDLETAEIILRARLREAPDDADALQLLADFAVALGYEQEAEALLHLAVAIAPNSAEGILRLASMLNRTNRPDEALDLLDRLLSDDPTNLHGLNFKAAALVRNGRLDDALQHYERSLAIRLEQPQTWSAYGLTLRSRGRMDESVTALRQAIELAPQSGKLWSSLADLKTLRFSRADADHMMAQLARAEPDSEDRMHFQFALGKAFEDLGDYAAAFSAYAEANRLQQRTVPYDPDDISDYVDVARRSFSAAVFRDRAGWGVDDADPIFIVGMPRSGSTLVEQILGSHSQIEATMELPELPEIVGRLAPHLRDVPPLLLEMPRSEIDSLGRDYIERTRRYRQTAKPLFVDKMPNNWRHVPLIHLTLPNARIIDVRRHPLDCCLSNFKQMFFNGQGFSNDLARLGRYYSDYVALMRHMDEQLPGRIHRVDYEHLIDDPEREVRRLLDHVGVPFEPACLRFHEGDRMVRTASSDQVRQPFNRGGIARWRHYEPWLGDLKAALKPVLENNPN